jgi:hypothetical protein
MRQLALLLVLLPALARAAVFDAATQGTGTLATAQTATGATANSLKMGVTKFRTVVFTMTNTAGTATAQLEINCTGVAADWALVSGTSSTLTVSAAAVSVVYPLCSYRVNVTACSTCSVNVGYTVGPELQ